MAVEKCTNCERTIGNMETPCVFDGHVVCAECHARLSAKPETGGAVANTPNKLGWNPGRLWRFYFGTAWVIPACSRTARNKAGTPSHIPFTNGRRGS